MRRSVVNPARAGMIPAQSLPRRCWYRKPRAGGDDPEYQELQSIVSG